MARDQKKEKGHYSQRGTAMLNDIRRFTGELLTEAGVAIENSEQISNELMHRVAGHWGGQLLYVGHGHAFTATKRDKQIYAEFKGHNHAELAQKYNLGVVYIYTIIKRMRKLELERVQPDMFGDDLSGDGDED